jgi:hypothetical protein
VKIEKLTKEAVELLDALSARDADVGAEDRALIVAQVAPAVR